MASDWATSPSPCVAGRGAFARASQLAAWPQPLGRDLGLAWLTVARGLGHHIHLQLLGVLAPGLILLIELTYWRIPPDQRQSVSDILRYLSAQSEGISTPIEIAFYALVAVVGYMLGFVMRQATWRVMLRLSHEPEWRELYDYMCQNFRRESVDAILSAHPALLRTDGLSADAVRRYCKTWLQMHEPKLGVEHLEVEVNVLFAYISPLIAAPFVVLWPLDSRPLYWILAPTAAATIGLTLALVGRRLRQDVEPRDTMMNFFIAQWIQK